MPSAAIIELTAAQRHRITKLAGSQRMPHRVVLRARIVHLAARGLPNATIAGRLNVTDDTVGTWRGRFAADGMAGLTDGPAAEVHPATTSPGQGVGLLTAGHLRRATVDVELPGAGH